MKLDNQTLILASSMVNILFFILFTISSTMYDNNFFKKIAFGFGISAIGNILISQQLIINILFSGYFANLLLLVGGILILEGILYFSDDKKSKKFLIILLVVHSIFYLSFLEIANMRILIFSVSRAIIFLLFVIRVFSSKEKESNIYLKILGYSHLAFIGVYMLLIAHALNGEVIEQLIHPNLFFSILLLVSVIFENVVGFNIILMGNESIKNKPNKNNYDNTLMSNLLKETAKASNIGCFVIYYNTYPRTIWANDFVSEILGLEKGEEQTYVLNNWTDIDCFDIDEEIYNRFQENIKKGIIHEKIVFKHIKDNQEKYYQIEMVSFEKDKNGNVIKGYGTFVDVDKHFKTEQKLERINLLNSALKSLSINCIEAEIDMIDDKINSALEVISGVIGIDRAYTARYDFDKDVCYVTHRWCKPEHSDLYNKQSSLLNNLFKNGLFDIHKNGTSIVFDSIEDVENEVSFNLLNNEDIKCLVLIPVFIKGELFGFIGVDSVTSEHNFSTEEIDLIESFAIIYGSLVNRKNIELTKIQNEFDFEKIMIQESTGILMMDAIDSHIYEANPATLSLFKCNADSIIGKCLIDFAPEFQPRNVKSEVVLEEKKAIAKEHSYCKFEFNFLLDGEREYLYCEIELRYEVYKGEKTYLASIKNISSTVLQLKELAKANKNMEIATYSANIAYWEIGVTSKGLSKTDSFMKMIGYDPAIETRTVTEFWVENLHKDDNAFVNEAFESYRDGLAEQYDVVYRLFNPILGKYLWLRDIGIIDEVDENGDTVVMLGVVQNITEKKEDEERIRISEERLRIATENTNIVTWEFDVSNDVAQLPKDFVKIYGGEQTQSNALIFILSKIHKEDVKKFVNGFKKHIEGSITEFSGEYRILNKKEDYRWAYISGKFTNFNEKNEHKLISGIIMDIDDQKKREELLKQESITDELTGVFNAKHLASTIEDLKKQKDPQVILGYLNVIGFRNINNAYGYEFGDKVIKAISDQIKDVLASKSSLFRLAGDDFVFLSTNEKLYNDICYGKNFNNLNNYTNFVVRVDGIILNIRLRVGIVLHPNHTEKLDNILQLAETTLLQAKNDTTNSFAIFDKSVIKELEYEKQVVVDVSNTNFEKEFIFYYQPIVNMDSDNFIVEALLRWNHPTRGFLTPCHFIDIIERSGQLLELNPFLLKQLLIQMKKFHDETGKWIEVSYNVSTSVIQAKDSARKMVDIVREAGINPKLIGFEILEGLFDNHNGIVAENLKVLREGGFKISIDDFGLAYSNLSRISNMEFDILKIDKSFTDRVFDDSTVVIIKMLRELTALKNVKCIVEGVETKEQLNKFKEMNFNHIQGFYFYEPMEASKIIDLIK